MLCGAVVGVEKCHQLLHMHRNMHVPIIRYAQGMPPERLKSTTLTALPAKLAEIAVLMVAVETVHLKVV